MDHNETFEEMMRYAFGVDELVYMEAIARATIAGEVRAGRATLVSLKKEEK